MKETGEITLFENLNKKDKEIESLRREKIESLRRDLAHKIDFEDLRLQEYTLQTTSPVSELKFNELKVHLSVSVV